MFRVEYKAFDAKTGFGWSSMNFDTLLDATNFYNREGVGDLLIFEKFKGYFYIYSK